MDLIERFRYVMKLNSMTASQFADEIGVQRSSVSHILSGRNKPSLEFIQKVMNRFPKVDSTWLINGKTNIGSAPKNESEVKIEKPKQETVEKPKELIQNKPDENALVDKSTSARQIKKVLVFYSDGTFEEYLSATTS